MKSEHSIIESEKLIKAIEEKALNCRASFTDSNVYNDEIIELINKWKDQKERV